MKPTLSFIAASIFVYLTCEPPMLANHPFHQPRDIPIPREGIERPIIQKNIYTKSHNTGMCTHTHPTTHILRLQFPQPGVPPLSTPLYPALYLRHTSPQRATFSVVVVVVVIIVAFRISPTLAPCRPSSQTFYACPSVTPAHCLAQGKRVNAWLCTARSCRAAS